MQQDSHKYSIAEEFEKAGDFKSAYQLFTECLLDKNLDYGEILFKCGWCLENTDSFEPELVVSYYLKAGGASKNIDCRMNSFFRAGWILMHAGKNEEAIKSYKYAIQIGHAEGYYGIIYYNSMYWCALCFESEGRYLDAIKLYRTVRELSADLSPESRYREIICLIRVGQYSEAEKLCNTFTLPAPMNFSIERYNELRLLVENERILLKKCNDEIIEEEG